MNHIHYDCLLEILPYINHRNKLFVLSSSKIYYLLRLFIKLRTCHIHNVVAHNNSKSNYHIHKLVTHDDFNSQIRKLRFWNIFSSFYNHIKLPHTLTHITFGSYFNQNIDFLPDSIRYLRFRLAFNRTINKLPKKLIYLHLGYYYNKPLCPLPSTLEYLFFGNNFNQSINLTKTKIKYLVFRNHFNKPIDKLPVTLKYIQFGTLFNQSINHLHDNIERIIFGSNKYSVLIKHLPTSLKYLQFRCDNFNTSFFNHHVLNHFSMACQFPPLLKYIELGFDDYLNLDRSCYFHETDNFKISRNKKKISFGRNCKQLPKVLPQTLTHVTFNASRTFVLFPNLPPTITYLVLSCQFINTIKMKFAIPNVKFIKYGYGSKFNIAHLPASLEYLSVCTEYIHNFSDLVTATPILKYIKFIGTFDQPVQKFPPLVKYINLGYVFDNDIDEFPSGLETLIYKNKFNKIPQYLPDSLLRFNSGTCVIFIPLPMNLVSLITFAPFYMADIPKSLQSIKCRKKYQNEIPKWVTSIELV